MNIWDDPETTAACRLADVAFKAWRKAQTKVSQSRRPDSLILARKACQAAESEYRRASAARDEAVEVLKARQMQRSATPTSTPAAGRGK